MMKAPIDSENDEGADDGCDETSTLAIFIPAHGVAEPSGDESAGDSEKDGDEAAARVAPRH
jgi:hypothetical protein